MNTLWKKIVLGALALGLVVAVVIYLTGGRTSESVPSYVNPAFAEHISSYSAGVLSSGSPIRIILAQDAVDSAMIGQESSVRLFSLSPAVSGKVFWIDKRTVEFKPDSRLASGQVYNVEFSLA
ncbi:MAG TPA: hypothetical protein VFW11_04135, partial [Cyclobacteriaceae bacterium]|nr:hypothetical protein [Cyclobacteriaceae bacterium]